MKSLVTRIIFLAKVILATAVYAVPGLLFSFYGGELLSVAGEIVLAFSVFAAFAGMALAIVTPSQYLP